MHIFNRNLHFEARFLDMENKKYLQNDKSKNILHLSELIA